MGLLDKITHHADNIIWKYTNIYPSAIIGKGNTIGSYVEIDGNVRIGNNNRIGAYSFIPNNVVIGDNCFIGPRVTCTNDKFPPSGEDKWGHICIEDGAAIGAGVVVVTGVTIGSNALVGAGSVVTKDIPANEVWAGNPATFMRKK